MSFGFHIKPPEVVYFLTSEGFTTIQFYFFFAVNFCSATLLAFLQVCAYVKIAVKLCVFVNSDLQLILEKSVSIWSTPLCSIFWEIFATSNIDSANLFFANISHKKLTRKEPFLLLKGRWAMRYFTNLRMWSVSAIVADEPSQCLDILVSTPLEHSTLRVSR